MAQSLAAFWREAAHDLDLRIEAPFTLSMPSGKRLDFTVCLRDFGARKGMLLLSDLGKIEKYTDTLVDLGFGYSTLSDPFHPYDREACLDMLRDWGWSGPEADRPAWL